MIRPIFRTAGSSWKIRELTSLDFTCALKRKIRKKEQLIEALDSANVLCIASRENDYDFKYYMYGKRSGTQHFDLMEINVHDGEEIEVIVKYEQKGMAQEALTYIKGVLEDEGYI